MVWMRSWLAPTLAAALLLASTSSLVRHDVGEEHEPRAAAEGFECVLDHAHAEASGAAAATPQWASAGAPHLHHCFACQLSGHRAAVESWQAASLGLTPAPAVLPTRRLQARALPPWTGRTLRGPPSA